MKRWLALTALCCAVGGAVQAQVVVSSSTSKDMITGDQLTDRAAMGGFLVMAAGLMTTHVPHGDPFSDYIAQTGLSEPGQAVLKGVVSTWQQDFLQIQDKYKADKAFNGYSHDKFLARIAAEKALVDKILNTTLPEQLSESDLNQFKKVYLPWLKGNIHADKGVS